MKKVAIIIPVFNQWSYTEQCLRSIYDFTPHDLFDLHVFDNGSSDSTPAELAKYKERHANLTVKRSSTNLGFSPACNLAAQECSSEFLLFLNNDTVVSSGWLEGLLSEFADQGVGVCGPKLLYPGGKLINHAGYSYNYRFGLFYPIYHNEPADFGPANSRRDYQALLGACLLMPSALFKAVGEFWEHGLEDIDLCLKIKESGRAVRYAPRVTLQHAGSVTLRFSAKGSYPETSNEQFCEKWLRGAAIWDDYLWYASDGSRPLPAADSKEASLEKLERSYQLTTEGITLRRQKDLPASQNKFRAALEVWPLNPDALSELMVVNLELSDLPAALHAAKKICAEVGFSGLALIEAAQVLAACGEKEQAGQIFQRVLSMPNLNPDLLAYAQSLSDCPKAL